MRPTASILQWHRALALGACAVLALGAAGALALSTGCAPDVFPWTDLLGDHSSSPSTDSPASAANGTTTPNGASSNIPDPQGLTSPDGAAATTPATSPTTVTLSGQSRGVSDAETHDLGSAAAGEEVTIVGTAGTSAVVVALFDQDYRLLKRGLLSVGGLLDHVLRADVSHLYVAVAPASGNSSGAYMLQVTRQPGQPVPAPQRQAVYVDFGPATNLTVNNRRGLTFPAFDAAMLGQAFAGQTAHFKQLIMDEIRTDYGPYNVDFYCSDDGPPPAEPYSVLHFGGDGQGLLGLADNVDSYNSDQTQHAVVFVNAYSLYDCMNMTTAQMAQMVGNTAAHELGHLLGLYHVADVTEVMDTSATAWQMTRDQVFGVGALASSVFPLGVEDAPMLLEETVGLRPADEVAAASAKTALLGKQLDRKVVHELLGLELPTRCGTCLHPDE